MLNLERAERIVIALLALSLIAGIAISAWRGAAGRIKVRVERQDPEASDRRAVSAQPSLQININQAGAEELMRLNGIGKVIAARIIEYRSQNGSFLFPEDVKKVKGFGKALFDKVKDQIYVE